MNKIIFILAILYKSLHLVLGSEDSDKTGLKPGIHLPSTISSPYGLCLGEADAVR